MLCTFLLDAQPAPPDPSAMSVAAQVAWIIIAACGVVVLGAGLWFARRVWADRQDYDARFKEHDDRFDEGNARFYKIEADLTEVKLSMSANTKTTEDLEKKIDKLDNRVERVDEKLDDIAVKVASSSAKMDQAARDVTAIGGHISRFFDDSHPGRGITSKLRKAVRDVVKPEALSRPDETLFPEADEIAAAEESEETPLPKHIKNAPSTITPVPFDKLPEKKNDPKRKT